MKEKKRCHSLATVSRPARYFIKTLLIGSCHLVLETPDAHIVQLPAEILVMTVNYLVPVAATCFGLTFKIVCEYCKSAHQPPVSMNTEIHPEEEGDYP